MRESRTAKAEWIELGQTLVQLAWDLRDHIGFLFHWFRGPRQHRASARITTGPVTIRAKGFVVPKKTD